MAAGITTLLLTAHRTPSVLIGLLALYMFKVIYGFAVDHYAGGSACCTARGPAYLEEDP